MAASTRAVAVPAHGPDANGAQAEAAGPMELQPAADAEPGAALAEAPGPLPNGEAASEELSEPEANGLVQSGAISPSELEFTPTGRVKLKRGAREAAALGKAAPPLDESRVRKLPRHLSDHHMTPLKRRRSASLAPAGPVLSNGLLGSGSLGGGAPLPGSGSGFMHRADSLQLSPGSKSKRTTVGRPQSSPTPAFAALEAWPPEQPPGAAPGVELQPEAGASLELLVAALRERAAGEQLGRMPLARLLASGVLSGQALAVRPQPGEGQEIQGRLLEGGRVACGCADCGGAAAISLAQFEEHAGVSDRRPGERVQLAEHGVSLKALAALVQGANGLSGAAGAARLQLPPHERPCGVCARAAGGTLRCGRCRARAHPACVGVDPHYTGPWSCAACAAAAAEADRLRAAEAGAKAAMRGQRGGLKSGGRGGRGGRGGSGPKPQQRKSQGSKPQRVHMAAPTAKVGLSSRRLARNSNKHKRLFDPDEPDGVKDGERVEYRTTQGEKLLEGVVRVSRDGPCGILCACCDRVISCSQFEAHAGRGSRRAPYDNIVTMAGVTLRRLAAALPADSVAAPADELEEDGVQEDMMGGCVLCEEKNFQRDGFSDLTVLLCDQCEREFHVGCLRQHAGTDLQELPTGDWFCSGKCREVHAALRAAASSDPVALEGTPYEWQLLHGKDGRHATAWALKHCHEILQESFDPIIDQVSGQDLLRGMVYSEKQGEWDHTGMFAAVLRHKRTPVCALVARAFGDMLAEVPLIATKPEARRCGHARFLMDALSALLAQVGVRTLSLPAAHATVDTWVKGFGFAPMEPDTLLAARESFRLLVFPGTEVLAKPLLPGAPPYVPPVRAPARPKPQPAGEEAAEPGSGAGGEAPAAPAGAGPAAGAEAAPGEAGAAQPGPAERAQAGGAAEAPGAAALAEDARPVEGVQQAAELASEPAVAGEPLAAGPTPPAGPGQAPVVEGAGPVPAPGAAEGGQPEGSGGGQAAGGVSSERTETQPAVLLPPGPTPPGLQSGA